MTLVCYISSHGFGHSVRTAQVIRALPPQIPVLIRSMTPRWFFEQELPDRPFTLEPARFDVGALGPDSIGIDPALTFREAARVHAEAMAHLAEETEFLRQNGARAVLCDAPAPPLVAARSAGIPALLLANFTWVEIYAELLARSRHTAHEGAAGGRPAPPPGPPALDRDLAAEAGRLIGDLRRRYAEADAHLIPGLAIDMKSVARRIDIPIIARRGRPDRLALADLLAFDPDRPIIQVYLGAAGLVGMAWEKLAYYEREQFFSFTPVPGDVAAAIRILPETGFPHADATASADAVVGKLGYSLCAECLASGIPILYAPREDFAEFPALESAMKKAGLAVPLSHQAFRGLEWRAALKKARAARTATLEDLGERLPDTDGAHVAAALLAETWRTGSTAHLG